jgi:hypothetical protein
MSEVWKKAVSSRFSELVNDIEVSSFGRIMKSKTFKLYKSQTHKGYSCFKRDGKRLMIAHLVAETHIGKRPEGLVIDHIDGNKENNRLDNLRYITPEENNRKGCMNIHQYSLNELYSKLTLIENKLDLLLSQNKKTF